MKIKQLYDEKMQLRQAFEVSLTANEMIALREKAFEDEMTIEQTLEDVIGNEITA